MAAVLRREKDVDRPHWRYRVDRAARAGQDVVRAFRPRRPDRARARVSAGTREDGTAYPAVLSLTDDTRARPGTPVPGVQPNVTVDEWEECDAALRRHPDVLAALARRGITDLSLVFIDTWTYGAPSIPDRLRAAVGSAGATPGCATPTAPTPTPHRSTGCTRRRPEHDGAAGDRGHPAGRAVRR